MGFEYNLKFDDAKNFDLKRLKSKLDIPNDTDWDEFKIELTNSGLYFCDNVKSDAAAIAFKKIIDEILTYSNTVVIEEL